MSDNANVLVQMLESMTGTKWIIVGVLLLILEVVTGTTYILWPAVAALVCLLYTSPSPRDGLLSRMPSSA